jgi:hypothetical protein
VVNTYKHIKAEHDAGHRSKGILEKMFFEKKDKGVGGKERDVGKVRKEKGGERELHGGRLHHEGRGRVGQWKPTVAEREAWERHKRREKDERDRSKIRDEGKHGERKVAHKHEDKKEERKHEEREDHRKPDQRDKRAKRDDGKLHKRPPTPEIRVVSPTPPDRWSYVPSSVAEVVPSRRPVPSSSRSSTSPPPPAPEPPQWVVSAPPVPQPIDHQREVSSSREPDTRSEADHSQTIAAASYYDQAPRPPMSGSYGE